MWILKSIKLIESKHVLAGYSLTSIEFNLLYLHSVDFVSSTVAVFIHFPLSAQIQLKCLSEIKYDKLETDGHCFGCVRLQC